MGVWRFPLKTSMYHWLAACNIMLPVANSKGRPHVFANVSGELLLKQLLLLLMG